MSLKNNKLLKKKWITTPLIIFVYFIFLGILPRFTGWITIIGAIGTGVYLVAKSEKFKSYNRIVKSSIIIILGFFVLIGSGFTTITPEKIQQSKLAAEKIKLENKNKKEAEEKAKKEEETRKVEEEKTKATNASGNGELKVHFIDVGQADSILIQQGNASMLIDAGNNDDDKTIKNYLDSHGIKELTYVIGTHSHEDHIGGLDYIINSLKVGKVYFPKQTATTKTFKDFTGAVKGKGLQLTEPKVGESFNLGEAKCTMLAPNGSSYEDTNDYSIVIKLTYGGTSFLFTGDAEAVSEMEMVNAGVDLKANVLKVGHHGSKSSTCANFLDIVNPQYAVISVGKDNEYGHPVQSTMDRLKNKDIKVYRTDEQGTIIATSNGKEITFDKDPGSYTGKVSAENNSSNNSNNNLGDNSNNNSSNNLENNSNNNANNNLSNNSRKTVSSEASSTKEITPVTPPLSNNNTSATTQTNNGGTVYWLSTGKSYSYHKDLNCRYIKGKQTNSGSIQDAINSKHGDPCDKCVH